MTAKFEIRNVDDNSIVISNSSRINVLIDNEFYLKKLESSVSMFVSAFGDLFAAYTNRDAVFSVFNSDLNNDQKNNAQGYPRYTAPPQYRNLQIWIAIRDSLPIFIHGAAFTYINGANISVATCAEHSKCKALKENKYIQMKNESGEIVWGDNSLRQMPTVVAVIPVPIAGDVISHTVSTYLPSDRLFIMASCVSGDIDELTTGGGNSGANEGYATTRTIRGLAVKKDGYTFKMQSVFSGRNQQFNSLNLTRSVIIAYIPEYDVSFKMQ